MTGVSSVPEAKDRVPPFLSRRIKSSLTELLLKLASWDGHRYNELDPVPRGGMFTGWKGAGVFAFQAAKTRFPHVFAEDIASDQNLMVQSFKNGQRDVLESLGLWSDELESMDPQTFWQEFIPPEEDQPCKRSQLDQSAEPCDQQLAFADTLQGHFLRRWESNDGDLFSLDTTIVFRAAEDDDNVSGVDEIHFIAGLNGDYIDFKTSYLVKAWERTVTLAELGQSPRLLLATFEEAFAFLQALK